MAPGRERSGPPERRSLAPRSATITVMIRAAFAAAKNLKRDFGEVEQLQISEKGPGDFVSAADRRADETLIAELRKARPTYGFLTEESGAIPGADTANRWIVDPLDGTTNFLHGIPQFAISIGLERAGAIIAGVIHDPLRDETFWAEKGNGAFVDTPNARSRRLRVSGRKDPARALVGTGIPHLGKGDHAAYHAKLAAVTERTAGVRRWGAGALDLAFVAAGRYDAFFEFGLQPWDVAAGILLVREAGGVVSDIFGKPYELGGPSLLASNFGLRDSMVEILSKAEPRCRHKSGVHRAGLAPGRPSDGRGRLSAGPPLAIVDRQIPLKGNWLCQRLRSRCAASPSPCSG
jgi:myo-inositol-1(or 4)-monophosphatase